MASIKKKKTSAEEVRRKAADRQRRRRAQLTAEQLEERRMKDKVRYQKKKADNRVKTITDCSDREKRQIRKKWRKNSKNYRARIKNNNLSTCDTPPDSEVDEPLVESVQKARGRKIRKRDRAKAYRKIAKQELIINNLTKRADRYKRKYFRFKASLRKTTEMTSPSPNKKVATLVGPTKVSPAVSKQLFRGFVLEKQLKSQVNKNVNQVKKNHLIKTSIGNHILRKYRVQTYFKELVSRKIDYDSELPGVSRNPKKARVFKIKHLIAGFFENDKVSQICPGKRDFVKKKKLKMQRRLLLDSIPNIHRKFTTETGIKISYASFLRYKPFWVTQPKARDRETCACIKHANFQLLLSALSRSQVITEKSVEQCLAAVTCNIKNRSCMMGQCGHCNGKKIHFVVDDSLRLRISQWSKITEENKIKNVIKKVSRFVKDQRVAPVSEVEEKFHNQLSEMKRHVFYWHHQASQIKAKTASLKETEIMFRVDFSENYYCKYANEIQAMHFGASKRQVSLHTVVRYHRLSDGSLKHKSFCTISDNLDHQAHAVWAHMSPILDQSSKDFPGTKAIHFFSDSPTSQYKNKINIELMRTSVIRYFPLVQEVTWNYTEPGHGKGPMDGVGGTVKRRADEQVSKQKDITCAGDIVRLINDGDITVMEISGDDIDRMKRAVKPENIPPITGITKVFQVTLSKNMMSCRSLSCFECPATSVCKHYCLKEILSKPLKLRVDDVFSSDEDPEEELRGDEQVCSNEEDSSESGKSTAQMNSSQDKIRDIIKGVYVEVKVKKGEKSDTFETFKAVCDTSVDAENEVEVTFFKKCSKRDEFFILNELDVSSISVNDIIRRLPDPLLHKKGRRVFYQF